MSKSSNPYFHYCWLHLQQVSANVGFFSRQNPTFRVSFCPWIQLCGFLALALGSWVKLKDPREIRGSPWYQDIAAMRFPFKWQNTWHQGKEGNFLMTQLRFASKISKCLQTSVFSMDTHRSCYISKESINAEFRQFGNGYLPKWLRFYDKSWTGMDFPSSHIIVGGISKWKESLGLK